MIIIDFVFLITVLTPPSMRRNEFTLYLSAIMKPLRELHDLFQKYFNKVEYELIWNGQVCMLEELLNQEFNPTSFFPRIYISDMIEGDDVYLYNTDENNEETFIYINSSNTSDPLYTSVYIYQTSESLLGFIIHMPIGLGFDLNYFNALVNKYKLPTTKYSIVYE